MKVDKLRKSTDFMTNVLENMEIRMSGNVLLSYLITYLSQQLFRSKYFAYMEDFLQV